MTREDLSNREALQAHLETFNIYDLQRLLLCFQYELGSSTADKESVQEIIECIKNSISKVS